MKPPVQRYVAHLEILEASARGYIDTLRALTDDPDPDFRNAAVALIETTTAALDQGPNLSLDDVRVTIPLINRVPDYRRAGLLNQQAPGFGDDGASLVAIGTEQAFDISDARSLTLHNLALSTLWLTDSRSDILAKIADEPSWAVARDEPFHIFPNGYYENRPSVAETTTILSMLVGGGATRDAGIRLIPRLGHNCYTLDLSVRPSRRVAAGALVTPARENFLDSAMPHLRGTARALLYYGSRISPKTSLAVRLNAIFLGLDNGTRPEWNIEDDNPRLRLLWTEGSDRRRVIFARALSQDVPNAYITRLREIIAPAVGTRDA